MNTFFSLLASLQGNSGIVLAVAGVLIIALFLVPWSLVVRGLFILVVIAVIIFGVLWFLEWIGVLNPDEPDILSSGIHLQKHDELLSIHQPLNTNGTP